MLTSCHGAQGTADLPIDQRAFGCLTPDNQQCNDGQANLLDTNMPQFNVRNATFTLERLDPSATCETIANALPLVLVETLDALSTPPLDIRWGPIL